jgi:hypothetical protein
LRSERLPLYESRRSRSSKFWDQPDAIRHYPEVTDVILALLRKCIRVFPAELKLAPHDNPSHPSARLSLITSHLNPSSPTRVTQPPSPTSQRRRFSQSTESRNKSAEMSTQAPHPTLLIPGPIEFDDAVLRAMSHYRYLRHSLNLRA